MSKRTALFLTFVMLIGHIWAQEAPLLQTPALSKDGSQLAFSYQGDIWTMPLTGSQAIRLTIHEAYETSPRFSPDGKNLVFSSDRYGNADLFRMSTNGGAPTRLTYHSASDRASCWTEDGSILFETRRMFAQVEREWEIYQISAEGGTPQRHLDGMGFEPVVSPDGRYVAFVRGTCRAAREAYRGPANRNIWLYDRQNDTYTQLTTDEGQDLSPNFGVGGQLYFLSARTGRYNLYLLTLDDNGKPTQEPTQITKFKDHGIRTYAISETGQQVVYERMGGLYHLDRNSKKTRQINPNMSGDYRFDPIEHKRFSGNISDYAISPNRQQIAAIIRGEVVLMLADKEKKRALNLTDHPYRDRDVQWLDDTTLIFASDRGGNYDLYLMRSADADEPNLYKTFKREIIQLTDTEEDEHDPIVAPDGKQLVFERGRGQLIATTITAGELGDETLLLDGWDEPGSVRWSPDSRWLAYSLSDLNFNSEVYIHAADNSQPAVNVSMHPRGDYNPVWSPDGSKLGFLSIRNNGDADVWFAWLREQDWEKTQRDWEEDEDEEDTIDPDSLEIDFKDIHMRLEQVTSLPGNESDLAIGPEGEWFYFVANRTGRAYFDADQDLYKIKWNGEDRKALTSGNTRPYGVSLEPGGKKLYHLKRGGSLGRIAPAKSKSESVPFSLTIDINHPEEMQQMFAEGWNALNAGFYDPQFHGRNWEKLRKTYEPWCMSASTITDFRRMFNWMLGQLDASHMGMYGGDREETQRERTGMLGLELIPGENGVEISSILPGSPADRKNSKLNVGETITAINDVPVGGDQNFYELLTNTANEQILLTVSNGADVREVVIRPTFSLRGELYRDWVEERKRLTETYSNGRLGYIHIQGMNWPSFERFERELTAAGLGKEGIVIDVRYNGGGWTTDYLMAVLNVKQHAYTVPRGAAENLEKQHAEFKNYYPYGERLPLAAWTGPAVALCNANSYSNAEIFSHAFKTLDRGTLVGIPTFGAVISTGGSGLIDGSYVRMPFRAWYVKATGENMEHGPAVPDIVLDNAPDSKAKNVDEQLKAAVDALLSEIEE